MPTTLEVGLVALNERYDDDDPRWRDQVADLVHELRRETESVQSRRAPVPGTKGTVDQLILALGSAGAFTAAVDVVRAWLARRDLADRIGPGRGRGITTSTGWWR